MNRFQGAGTALVTPFTADGRVDHDALERLVEWQIAEGIDFLVGCGSTGEAQTLTFEERQEVVATIIRTSAGRVPVVAGATSNDTAWAITETRAMVALGADAILSACPYYNKPTQAGLEAHFTAIADASARPIVLYNVPGRTAVNMTAATTLRLARHPNIIAVKEASADLPQMMKIVKDRPSGFLVLSGDDAFTLPLIAVGGDGIISVVSNEIPRLMHQLAATALAGDFAAAREIHYRILPLIDANFLETNPSPAKTALALMGRTEPFVRLPLVPAGEATREALRAALAAAGALAPELV
jgi:4-hydroxy-tetrahydrodipicolinate synthase